MTNQFSLATAWKDHFLGWGSYLNEYSFRPQVTQAHNGTIFLANVQRNVTYLPLLHNDWFSLRETWPSWQHTVVLCYRDGLSLYKRLYGKNGHRHYSWNFDIFAIKYLITERQQGIETIASSDILLVIPNSVKWKTYPPLPSPFIPIDVVPVSFGKTCNAAHMLQNLCNQDGGCVCGLCKKHNYQSPATTASSGYHQGMWIKLKWTVLHWDKNLLFFVQDRKDTRCYVSWMFSKEKNYQSKYWKYRLGRIVCWSLT